MKTITHTNTSLFLIFINNLEDAVSSKVLKFGDYTQVFRTIKSDADKDTLQNHLTKLVKWSKNGRCYLMLGNVNAPI